MEAEEAFRRRRETFGKPCPHTTVEKEYEHGLEIEAWVCSECGSEFGSREVWEKNFAKGEKNKQ